MIEDVASAKTNMYNGASTTDDNRYGMQPYTLRRKSNGWGTDIRYTWNEAKARFVECMAEHPDEPWEIAAADGWAGDRICWKYSVDNPDYVACAVAEFKKCGGLNEMSSYEAAITVQDVERKARIRQMFARGYVPTADQLASGTKAPERP